MAVRGPVSRLAGSCKSNKISHSMIDNKLRPQKIFVLFLLFYDWDFKCILTRTILSELDIFTETPDKFVQWVDTSRHGKMLTQVFVKYSYVCVKLDYWILTFHILVFCPAQSHR